MKCLICFEDNIDNIINMKCCSCNISIHNDCLEKCISFGILCPICRLHAEEINYELDEFQDHRDNTSGFGNFITKIIMKSVNSNFYSLLLLLYSIIAIPIALMIYIFYLTTYKIYENKTEFIYIVFIMIVFYNFYNYIQNLIFI